MIGLGGPVGEDDLHAYVDGRLDVARQAQVAAYLREKPAAAARVEGWRRADDALRAALAPKSAESVPAVLSMAHLLEARRSRFQPRTGLAAGFLLALSLGGSLGWWAHGNDMSSTGLSALAAEASSAHHLFAGEASHPVEFGPGQRMELASWATRALGYRVPAPDLSASGYRFLGGRVVTTEHGAACLYMYENAEANRVTLFMRPMRLRDQTAPMRAIGDETTPGFAWARDGLGFSLISSEPVHALRGLSDTVKNQMVGEI